MALDQGRHRLDGLLAGVSDVAPVIPESLVVQVGDTQFAVPVALLKDRAIDRLVDDHVRRGVVKKAMAELKIGSGHDDLR